MADNPLKGYFRRPSIYIKLPSNGKYWPAGTLEMPENKELAVLPMTAVDEITYRTPDALFNGQALVDVVQSCIPNIKNAWAIPNIDLDTILVAIRIASYGHSMDIDTTCPKCSEESTYALDLRTVLEGIKIPNFDHPKLIGDLEIHFKPLSYKQLTDNSIIQFEEQKLLSLLHDADINEEEKLKLVTEAFKKVSHLTLKAVRQGIHYIQTPDSTVSEPQYIDEFLHNCEKNIFDAVRDHIMQLRSNAELKPLSITCRNCGHEYKQPFTLDMTNFFG